MRKLSSNVLRQAPMVDGQLQPTGVIPYPIGGKVPPSRAKRVTYCSRPLLLAELSLDHPGAV